MKPVQSDFSETDSVVAVTTPFLFYKYLFYSSLSCNFPVAVWRLPDSSVIHFATDLSGKTKIVEPNLEELPAGFLCSPFLNEEVKKSYFIQADLHFTWENDTVSETQNLILSEEKNQRKELLFRTVREQLGSNQWVESNQQSAKDKKQSDNSTIEKSEVTQHSQFTELVRKGIQTIQDGHMQKVVLSRRKKVVLPEDFEVVEAFDKLCKAYPSAFVSLVYFPETGIWLGASPETLVSVDKNRIFSTMALAGTQKFDPNVPSNQAHWTMKEIEEQALVSRYIINCLKKIRVREFEEDGPKTVTAGNLIHLRTDFSIDTESINFPELPTVMLQLLHPTSAVCGMPQKSALTFIRQNEGYDRNLYSGFLGPVQIQAETHLFVNLRCMSFQNAPVAKGKNQTSENQQFNNLTSKQYPSLVYLYAGAGITAQSQPEKEWTETELKCQTLLNVIL